MGNMTSIPVELCATFDADEIRRLGKRFKKLDIDGSGSLSVQEFMSIPELQQNPLVQRVIDIFDTDGNGEIDFKEFIGGISQFSVKGDKESKLKFAFKIYDMDKDGFISNGELFQVLKMMVGSNLKDSQLQQIVDKTIINADKDGDGKISFDEFCACVGDSLIDDIQKKDDRGSVKNRHKKHSFFSSSFQHAIHTHNPTHAHHAQYTLTHLFVPTCF